MLVLKCAGAAAEVLADDAAESQPLLEPVPTVNGQLADGRSRPDRNSADRVAIRDRQFAQECGHFCERERGETGQGDDADVPSADARLESADQVLIAENSVQINGRS